MSRDELEDRVEERTTELRAALAQTQKDMAERRRLEEQLAQVQKLESIGRLAGGVAHDINNVLTVVLSYSDLVDAGLGPSHPLQAQLRQIRKAAERASNLTHRLLAFARKQIVEPRVINLGELSLNLDGMLRRLIGEDVELLTVTSPNLWSVKADPHQIEQVLVNLAVNARDAMPQGGTLRIETTNVVVDEAFARRHPTLKTGEHVRHVGERHRRRHGRTRDAAHVRAVLHDQGAGQGHRPRPGDVLRHRPAAGRRDLPGERAGQGHDLQRLPAARRPAGRADAAAARDAPSSAAPRRCCWSRTSRWCATSPRARCPTRATRCSRPSTARRRSSSPAQHGAEIQLVLTDVVMPKMGGRELVEQLRKVRPAIRVLYMSGYTAASIDEQDVVEPGTSFLRKPFALAEMLGKVREVLDATRAPASGATPVADAQPSIAA